LLPAGVAMLGMCMLVADEVKVQTESLIMCYFGARDMQVYVLQLIGGQKLST
jgi:hypothetical protein